MFQIIVQEYLREMLIHMTLWLFSNHALGISRKFKEGS